MTHTVIAVGDLVQVDQSFAGWLPGKVVDVVRERAFCADRYTVRAVVKITLTKPRSGYSPGEILTVDVSKVLPRHGWRTGTSPFRTYHVGGFCHAWAACEECGRMSSQVPQTRRDAR